ncbi:MAG TPA: phosphatase PAP2 family protein [Mucilaginibacter sp.]|nr:phosphatase PAP2 family protein [Mucilaginibacter sp.]
MPDFLIQIDRHLFYFINHDLANPVFDHVLPLMRNPKFWIPLYLFIIGFCIYKYKKQGLILIVFLALSAGFADFTSASIVKPLVKRDRPCRDAVVSKTDIVRVNCGTGYSFPSTHATDHFAMALFLIVIFQKKWRWIWFWAILWAGVISFAQVYVGVHFPIDVTCGALYGALVGWMFATFFKKIQPTFSA